MARRTYGTHPLRLAPEALADLVTHLDNDALGAALRLIELHLRNGAPVRDDTRARALAQEHPKRWPRIEAALREVFDTSGGAWVYRPVEEDLGRQRTETERRSAQTKAHPPRSAAGRPPEAQRPVKASAPVPAGPSTATETVAPPRPATAPAPQPMAPAAGPAADAGLGALFDSAAPTVKGAVAGPAAPAPLPPVAKSAKRSSTVKQQMLPFEGLTAPVGARNPMSDDIEEVTIAPIENTRSMTDQLVDRGVRLLMSKGRNEQQSRVCICSLVKKWDLAFVIKVVDEVYGRIDSVVDPFAYMKKRIAEYPTKEIQNQRQQMARGNAAVAAAPPLAGNQPNRVRPIATADTVGLSAGKIKHIRQQNAIKPKFVFEAVPGTEPEAA